MVRIVRNTYTAIKIKRISVTGLERIALPIASRFFRYPVGTPNRSPPPSAGLGVVVIDRVGAVTIPHTPPITVACQGQKAKVVVVVVVLVIVKSIGG